VLELFFNSLIIQTFLVFSPLIRQFLKVTKLNPFSSDGSLSAVNRYSGSSVDYRGYCLIMSTNSYFNRNAMWMIFILIILVVPLSVVSFLRIASFDFSKSVYLLLALTLPIVILASTLIAVKVHRLLREIEKLKDEVNERQLQLVHSEKMSSLGVMTARIAHEINNPLSIISGRCFQIQRHAKKAAAVDALLLKYVEEIELATCRIVRIVKGLKTFSRDSKKDPFEETTLLSIVEDSISFCEGNFRTQGVKFFVEEIYEGVTLNCRSVEISQVILNLLNNALGAIEGTEEPWVKVTSSVENEFVNLAITDSGKGVPAEIKEQIMQPFFTTKPKGKGTGLGLSISKQIIEDHGGTFRLDSHCENTRFVITLPIVSVIDSPSDKVV